MKKLLILTLFFLVVSQGYALRIKFNIEKAQNDTIVFGNYFGSGKNMIVLDTIILNNGIGEFKNDTLKSGLYFIYNNKNKYDLLLSDSEKSLKVAFQSFDFYSSAKIDGSPIASAFVEYMKFLNDKKERVKKDSTLAQATSKEVSAYINKTVAANKNNILGMFLNFYTPLTVPEGTDEFRYKYYKKHFFDNGNIFNPELLHTPLFEDKLNEYYSQLIEAPEAICSDLDTILLQSFNNKTLFRFILVNTFQHYLKSNQVIAENIWVHIAEKWYIPYATWSDFAYMIRLKDQVKARKPNLIGNKAPDFAMTTIDKSGFIKAQTDSLTRKDVYQGVETRLSKVLDNSYTLLIFFESDCSHCKEQMPLYWDVYQKNRDKGLKAIVVHNNNTPEGKVMWCDYVNANKMYDWVNCWSPYSNQYKDLYNIVSTPTVYLLNKGVIELKNIDSKTLDEYLKNKML